MKFAFCSALSMEIRIRHVLTLTPFDRVICEMVNRLPDSLPGKDHQ